MILFKRFKNSQLFLVDNDLPEADGCLAYFISGTPDPFPDKVLVNDSWNKYVGFYLFLKRLPAEDNMAKFADDIKTYFAQDYPDASYTGFAWIDYNLTTQSIDKATVVTTINGDNGVILNAEAQFTFSNYALPLRRFAPVTPVIDTAGDIDGFTFAYPPYEGWPKIRQEYNIQLPMSGARRGALSGQLSLGDLSNNVNTGWNASLFYVIKMGDEDVAQNYPVFDTGNQTGLQILFNYLLDPVDQLNPDRTYLAFTGTSFFLKQDEHGKWYIQINDKEQLPSFFRTVYGRMIDLIPLTQSDHPPKLVFEELPPVDGSPRFYLAPAGDFELKIRNNEAAADIVHDFLLCGLSGAESIDFVSKTITGRGHVLRFVPKRSAYATGFQAAKLLKKGTRATPASAALANEIFAKEVAHNLTKSNKKLKAGGLSPNQSGLSDKYKTSWVNIRPNTSTAPIQDRAKKDRDAVNEVPVYYSQPNDAALYDHDGVDINVYDGLLKLRNTAAAFFPAAVTQSLPMVPYGGVNASPKFSYSNIQQFETQVILSARRDVVSSIPVTEQMEGLTFSDELILTTTPQGLLATVPGFGLNWQSILLSKSQSKGVDYNLEFTNGITKQLRDAMQSNQLFLIATEAGPLGTFLNQITIADWPFTFNVGKGSAEGNFSNIVIFKFAEDSIENRIKDPRSWSNAEVFNQYPLMVSKWIASYIETAELNEKTDNRYSDFLRMVKTPSWNGILILKADIGVENFPADLKGLLAGIKKDEFYAHHFGLDVNFVTAGADGKLTLPKSSMFALINYIDKDYRARQQAEQLINSRPQNSFGKEASSAAQDELYDFKVLTLQVVFKNSEIKDFTSKIQLLTTAWFDEAAKLDVQNTVGSLLNQTIEFDGSYEKHNDVNTYTFVTSPNQTYKFLLDSQALNYVEIVKAQFFTITDQSQLSSENGGAGNKEKISSRFVFWGYMNFKSMGLFDLFSFGDTATDKNTHNQGLYFANLYIDMDFMLDSASGDASGRTFTFNPDRMSFDISQSSPRANSLFRNFPINLSALVHSKQDDDAKPSDQGFMPVSITSSKQDAGQALTKKWYALLYNLNLGSMGALAENAGFTSQISTAWSPGSAVKRITTGIRLPATGGQKTLSLQSVLSLNIQSFNFVSVKNEADNEKTTYLLKFNNVKLSLLGMNLPGAADTQFILFGDASGKDKTTLAWYAAYYNNPVETAGETLVIEDITDKI